MLLNRSHLKSARENALPPPPGSLEHEREKKENTNYSAPRPQNKGCLSGAHDIREAAETLAPHDIKFEHECYDVGHLYNLKFCMDIGLFKAPIFIQFIFGILGGIGPEVDNLVFMKRTADRLFGDDYRWSVLGAGGAQMTLATTASQMGGHVRVGLEDSLFISRGKLADNNAHQVAKIRRIVEDLGCEVATPDEARDILALKGGDRVNF